MSDNALLINYGYCSGCRSCELACRNEHNLPEGSWGIRVRAEEPWQHPNGKWNWDYLPVPTGLCDMCEHRVGNGHDPMCVQSCQAKVIEFGSTETMMERLAELGGKTVVFKP